jgi:beta-mannosidase
MKHTHNLSTLDWRLTGWHPYFWVGPLAAETPLTLYPDIPPLPARVPGSVQATLREAGLLPDWNVGVRSRECEWVENRHWSFETALPADWCAGPGRKLLRCEGLDYQGVVLVNGRRAGDFCGTYTPHEFDLTDLLADGENRLAIVFTDNPRSLGQVQYTSQITEMKERFSYIWDWCPRLVQIGIWDAITLEVREHDAITSLRLYADYDAASGRGTVIVEAQCEVAQAQGLEVIVQGPQAEVAHVVAPVAAAPHPPAPLSLRERGELISAEVPVPGAVEPWWPNGLGEQPLYLVRCRLLDEDRAILDEEARIVGFRQVEWKPCQDAPEGAEPWICCVNGQDLFLQGANWVPIRPNFADVTEDDYRLRLTLYRDLGFNLLRVWGGAVLEREVFYRLCDELGLLVWQEFPLSSSGLDNWPPEDPAVISQWAQIAESYVERRQHHPSLLLWCGGNELQGASDGGKAGIGKPIDVSHPMAAALGAVVRRLDPTRRFLPTSSTGPRFMADASEFGQGLHHDVHGPWNWSGDLQGWRAYWDRDDALFRSETGMPGAEAADLIRQYADGMELPADRSNPFWMHTGGWWIQWEDYLREGGDPESLDVFVVWSQLRQAHALAHAAAACKRRFPRCGGFMLWMGHDCYPCPVNTAIIDFLGRPKPAAEAVGKVFKGE